MDKQAWELATLRLFIGEVRRAGIEPELARAEILWKLRAYSRQLAGKHQFTMAQWSRELHSAVLSHVTVNELLRELRSERTIPPCSNRGVNSLNELEPQSLGGI